MQQFVQMKDGVLTVPNHPVIPFIEGDGVGPEVMASCQAVLNAAVKAAYKGEKSIEWLEVLAGGKSFEKLGTWLPDETLQTFEKALVGLKGPLTTPVGGGIRSLNVALRQKLDLYVCQRPVRWFEGVKSPVVDPSKVDMHIFRENTEDIYAGIEWEAESDKAVKFGKFLREQMGVTSVRFPETSAYGVKPVSKDGSRRLVRAAIQYAVDHNLPSVTLVHKGNIMKFTEGGFKSWGYALAKAEFGDKVITQPDLDAIEAKQGAEAARKAKDEALKAGKIHVKDCICDAFLQNALLYPWDYSVIATMNLNGDYISDMLAAMVGGIGIAPGANINYQSGHAIFEATHGTAPRIAGKNIVNPASLILSGVMMLEYLGWGEAAKKVENALAACWRTGRATADLAAAGAGLTTTDFTQAVINEIEA